METSSWGAVAPPDKRQLMTPHGCYQLPYDMTLVSYRLNSWMRVRVYHYYCR